MNLSGALRRGRGAVLQAGAAGRDRHLRRDRAGVRQGARPGRRRAEGPQRPALDGRVARLARLPARPLRRRPTAARRSALGRRLRARRLLRGRGPFRLPDRAGCRLLSRRSSPTASTRPSAGSCPRLPREERFGTFRAWCRSPGRCIGARLHPSNAAPMLAAASSACRDPDGGPGVLTSTTRLPPSTDPATNDRRAVLGASCFSAIDYDRRDALPRPLRQHGARGARRARARPPGGGARDDVRLARLPAPDRRARPPSRPRSRCARPARSPRRSRSWTARSASACAERTSSGIALEPPAQGVAARPRGRRSPTARRAPRRSPARRHRAALRHPPSATGGIGGVHRDAGAAPSISRPT